MKFVTFNIRMDNKADGVNSFTNRKGFILDKLENERPDIIAFQEMRPEMHVWMRRHLNALGYTLLGCGRGADLEDEHNPVAFLSDKYEPVSLNVSWLSDTPDVPGSRFEDQSSCPRIVTHLKLKGDFGVFNVFNTHLDHVAQYARIKGAELVLRQISAEPALPVIVSGDFNAYPDSEEVRLFDDPSIGLTELTKGIGTTWHDWGRKLPPQIDYIFTRGFKTDKPAVKWEDNLNGVYLSDHYPVSVEIEPCKEDK